MVRIVHDCFTMVHVTPTIFKRYCACVILLHQQTQSESFFSDQIQKKKKWYDHVRLVRNSSTLANTIYLTGLPRRRNGCRGGGKLGYLNDTFKSLFKLQLT